MAVTGAVRFATAVVLRAATLAYEDAGRTALADVCRDLLIRIADESALKDVPGYKAVTENVADKPLFDPAAGGLTSGDGQGMARLPGASFRDPAAGASAGSTPAGGSPFTEGAYQVVSKDLPPLPIPFTPQSYQAWLMQVRDRAYADPNARRALERLKNVGYQQAVSLLRRFPKYDAAGRNISEMAAQSFQNAAQGPAGAGALVPTMLPGPTQDPFLSPGFATSGGAFTTGTP